MGFYFRKSVRVGPLRFNLSKSGIGVSAGIPGFRIGTGPRGNYVHLGANGFYYRTTLPAAPASESRRRRPRVEPDFSPVEMERIESACVTNMTDSSSEALLDEINLKRKRPSLWLFAAIPSACLLLLLLAAQARMWFFLLCLAACLVAILAAWLYDLMSKTVVILYDLDPDMEAAYGRVHECLDRLRRCGGSWHIRSRGAVYDPKYHAGAGGVVDRIGLQVGTMQPPFLRTNLAIPAIELGDRTLYFFPERVLVFGRKGVGAIGYRDLSIVVTVTRFIESGRVPRDARIVDRTWRFVNKGGGPDRRFNNNHEIPICAYEEIWFNSPTGLNEIVQVSKNGLGDDLLHATRGLSEAIAKAARVAPTVQPVEEEEVFEDAGEVDDATRPWRVLLDVLCCMMAADGRVTVSERTCVVGILSRLRSPWSDSEVQDRIGAFIARIQHRGYRAALDRVLEEVGLFKQLGIQGLLIECLDEVAAADDEVSERELRLCQRIRMLVE